MFEKIGKIVVYIVGFQLVVGAVLLGEIAISDMFEDDTPPDVTSSVVQATEEVATPAPVLAESNSIVALKDTAKKPRHKMKILQRHCE